MLIKFFSDRGVNDRMKKILMILVGFMKMVLTTLTCSIIATCFMTIAFALPMNRSNLEASITLGQQEGWYVDVLEHIPSLEKYFVQFQPGTMTVADDVRGFKIADDHDGFNALENAMYCNKYPRYWHGYAAIMRLFFLVFDYKEMRFINYIVQFLLVIGIFVILREKGEKKISWLSLLWYVFMMPLSVACCLVYGYVVDAIFVSTIFAMLYGDKFWDDHTKFNLLFCVIGCIVCFFDLLIFSPMGWAMPYVMMTIIYGNNNTALQNLEKAVRSAVCWVTGYGLFWILKILYATVILRDKYGQSVMEGALSEAAWSAGKEDSEHIGFISKILERWSAIQTNYTHYSYTVYALLITILTVIVVFSYIRKGCLAKDSRLPVIMIAASSPVIWVFVINAATKAHHIFDYRLMSTEICCSLMIIILSLKDADIKIQLGLVIRRAGIVGAAFVVGFVLAAQFRESQYSMNADKGGMIDIPLNESGTINMEFRPLFGEIKQLGLSITPGNEGGEYVITLLNEGKKVGEFPVQAERFIESNWQMLDVDWKVSPGKNYELIVQSVGGSYGTVAALPLYADGCITEFGNIELNDADMDCQLVGWIDYRRRPSVKNMITYGMIISEFLVALTLALQSIVFDNKNKNRKMDV